MSSQDSTRILNDLLNRISRSLLQYVGESSTWTGPRDAARGEAFQALVRRQQFAAERIAGLLTERRAAVVLSNYPREQSALHFVTLDFVRPRLIEDEQTLISMLKSAVQALCGDPEAVRLVEQLLADEEQTLATLRAL